MRIFNKSVPSTFLAISLGTATVAGLPPPAQAGWAPHPLKLLHLGKDTTFDDQKRNDYIDKTNGEETGEKKKETVTDKATVKPAVKDTDKETDKEDGSDSQEQSKAPIKGEKPLDVIDADPELHYEQAKRLAEHKHYKEALVEVNKTLQLNKKYWDAIYLGAYIYQLEGRNKEAIEKYAALLKVRPDYFTARINLGVLLRNEGRLEEAETQYRKAINLNFYSLQAHYNLANLLIAKQDLEAALKELLACAKLAPTNAWVHNNLGVIYQQRDYLEEALDEFQKALNLEPANKSFEQNVAQVHEHIRNKEASNGNLRLEQASPDLRALQATSVNDTQAVRAVHPTKQKQTEAALDLPH